MLNETDRFTPIDELAVVDGQTFVGVLNNFNAALTYQLVIGNVQGGIVDLVVFGMLGEVKTHQWWMLVQDVSDAPSCCYAFHLVIARMNVETPDRESEDENPQLVAADERTQVIISGLGGRPISRMSIAALSGPGQRDDQGVNQTLMSTSSNGANRVSEHDIQVIQGPQVEKIASRVRTELGVTK